MTPNIKSCETESGSGGAAGVGPLDPECIPADPDSISVLHGAKLAHESEPGASGMQRCSSTSLTGATGTSVGLIKKPPALLALGDLDCMRALRCSWSARSRSTSSFFAATMTAGEGATMVKV